MTINGEVTIDNQHNLNLHQNKLKIDDVAVTATAAELNKLDGIANTLTTAELNVMDVLQVLLMI